MKYGVLGALADLWSHIGGAPAYSVNSMSALFGLATNGDVTREEWDRIAELVEGDGGAALVASALGTVASRAVRDDLVDDSLEPEPAPSDTQPPLEDQDEDETAAVAPEADGAEGACRYCSAR